MRMLAAGLILLGAQDKELAAWKPELVRPPDLADFWKRESDRVKHEPFNVSMTETVDPAKPSPDVRVWSLKWKSADGKTDVLGWYGLPAQATEQRKVGAVLTIPGYGGRRGASPPKSTVHATLVVGPRGFGDEVWPVDWMARGIEKIETPVIRFHHLNLVSALRFLQTRPEVDPRRLYLQGTGLGGAMALVLAGMLPNEIAGVVATCPGPDVYLPRDGTKAAPHYREMERALEKLAEFDREKAHRSLSYYSPVHFAPYVQAEALVACGGKDATSPARGVYSLFNHLGTSKKTMKYYPEGTHAGGPGLRDDWPRVSADWLLQRLQ